MLADLIRLWTRPRCAQVTEYAPTVAIVAIDLVLAFEVPLVAASLAAVIRRLAPCLAAAACA